MLAASHGGLLGMLLLLHVGGAQGGGDGSQVNMWNYRNLDGNPIEFKGDPSPGLNQRTCKHYYGQIAPKDGKEWASVNCTAPFDQVCVMLKGEAELRAYYFEMSYVRGCHFRCPCPDSQPWVEWYMGVPGNIHGHNIKLRWEKKCTLQTPPQAYTAASDALPFTKAKKLEVRCCKKHWEWLGHPNDTRKHPTHPKFAENYNRSVEARIGYFGKELPNAQPPVMLNEEAVWKAAEDCNDWPDDDPMSDWDKLPDHYYISGKELIQGYLPLSSVGRGVYHSWLTWLVTGMAAIFMVGHTG